ncbi:MAG TPA: CoA-acylating methylmalonate-semialdehyde dehydrogenase [Tepidisphaeraceae bacterium]|nr:CoA-acylating methylmalonate-semialdehyde dehydrogenase [Tepidisphaeraceae bacterium]
MTQTLKPAADESIEQVPLLWGGKWSVSPSARKSDVFNPSTGQVIARVPLCSTAEVNQVIETAHAALPAWANKPVVERVRYLFAFRELLVQHAEEIARCVTREHGKTLAESRASVQRGMEVVEFACGTPSLIMGQSIQNIAREVDCETIRHPVGVCAGITPFNFPAMVPLWMYPIAIGCGNTFILKPSEKVPLTAVMIGKLLQETGLPDGVFNIVHGDKEAVDALLHHPLVRAISFVGSTNVARYVYETGTRHGKRVQAAGGAKNHLIIMPDADLDQAVSALQTSAFGCAGERCMAGSVAVGVGDVASRLVDSLVDKAAKMTVGRTDQGADVDMGPVISREHLNRVAGYIDTARNEGASVALDGRAAPLAPAEGFFLGPSVIDRVQPDMRVATEEIFGPVLSVIRARNLDEALALGRNCAYGNGASIFTRDGYAARQFKHHFNAGMIGINIGVPAPMAWFPFTGWNKSFFGDLHIQGTESIQFYTQQKMTMTRWFASADEAHHDPVWKQR